MKSINRGDQSCIKITCQVQPSHLGTNKKNGKSSSHYPNYNSRFLYELLIFPGYERTDAKKIITGQ